MGHNEAGFGQSLLAVFILDPQPRMVSADHAVGVAGLRAGAAGIESAVALEVPLVKHNLAVGVTATVAVRSIQLQVRRYAAQWVEAYSLQPGLRLVIGSELQPG